MTNKLYANRGTSWENLLNAAGNDYKARGLAVVTKNQVKTKAIKARNGDVRVIRPERSIADFTGFRSGGRGIAFEAKSTREKTRFDLSNVEQHQVDYLQLCWRMKVISFFAIELVAVGAWLVPYPEFERYWVRWQAGGRASISLEELRQYPEIKPTRIAADYLAAWDRWEKEATV